MEDGAGTVEGRVDVGALADVDAQHAHAPAPRVRHVLGRQHEGRHGDISFEQSRNETATDEAGGARDEHGRA